MGTSKVLTFPEWQYSISSQPLRLERFAVQWMMGSMTNV